MEKQIVSQSMVCIRIKGSSFVKLNEVADKIAYQKRLADLKASEKVHKQFSKIASGLMKTKAIIYKGNQKFNLEYIEFADSRRLNTTSNKHSRSNSSTQHVANSEVILR